MTASWETYLSYVLEVDGDARCEVGEGLARGGDDDKARRKNKIRFIEIMSRDYISKLHNSTGVLGS